MNIKRLQSTFKNIETISSIFLNEYEYQILVIWMLEIQRKFTLFQTDAYKVRECTEPVWIGVDGLCYRWGGKRNIYSEQINTRISEQGTILVVVMQYNFTASARISFSKDKGLSIATALWFNNTPLLQFFGINCDTCLIMGWINPVNTEKSCHENKGGDF